MADKSFFTELRRRKVYQAAAIYGAIAWGVTEVVVTVVEQLFLPQWVSTLAVIGFVMGFPFAMFLAWTFDLTTDGIQRTEVSSRRAKSSIALSILLLIGSTGGLFFLIRPALEEREMIQGVTIPSDVLPNSIALLPFENTGPNSEDSYLGEGLSDELRDQLGQVSGLHIAARSSSIAAQGRFVDVREIAAQLGVAMLVEGSIRQGRDNRRVSVELIDGNTGLAIWSETFEAKSDQLIDVQQSIAEKLVQNILSEPGATAGEPASRDNTANEIMLLARHYEQQVRGRQEVDTETLQQSIDLYRQAIEIDPDSALAHSRLAGALLYLGDLKQAEAPIFKALSLDPNLSEVQNTLGEFYWARGLPEAKTAFARAVELNPNNADALHNYASLLVLSYNSRDVADLFSRARKLDPLNQSRHAALGEYYGQFGRVEETRAVIKDVQELFSGVEAFRLISWLSELTGDVDQAIAWAIKARDLEPDNPDHTGRLAELYTVIGDIKTAFRLESEPSVGLLYLMREYPQLIEIAEYLMIENPGDISVRYLLAFAYNATGEIESSIHILSSTGLPDTLINDVVRSAAEVEAFYTLVDALAQTNQKELALSLAQWNEEFPWWGDPGWVSLYRSCGLSTLGRDEEALASLSELVNNARLPRNAPLRDYHCFRKYKDIPQYQEILRLLDQRREALRKKLPETLASFGVSL